MRSAEGGSAGARCVEVPTVPDVAATGDTGLTTLATRDVDEAHAYIHSVFTPHRLVIRGEEASLDFTLRYAESPTVTLGHLTYGADVTVQVPPPEQCYHVVLPIEGACHVGQGAGRRMASAELRCGIRGAVLSPDDPLMVHWEPDSVGYVVKVPRATVEAHVARLVGAPVRDPVRFALDFDVSGGASAALAASVPFLWNELSRPGGIATMPVAREHLEYVVLTQLLTAVPHNYSDALTADRPAVRRLRSRVQRVVDVIEAHPEHALSSGHLAAVAGVTERALQIAFRKEFGTSPAAYVREVRLDRVHAELCNSGDGATVSEIATRWGFCHLSRFAQQYSRRFGMLPSETLAGRG
jgi:AraC-like DNA-binding protein